MSTFVAATDPVEAPAAGRPCTEAIDIAGRDVPLGRYTVVRRYLPDRELRTIGAWCFLDRIGPHAAADHPLMWVPPHPHIGLQTVTWLTEGEILHRDGVGSRQLVRPGELGIMTSGAGIAHSEESPHDDPMSLSGVQLWVALPSASLGDPPGYAFHDDLPRVVSDGLEAVVFLGSLGLPGHAPVTSPAVAHTPLLGAEISLPAAAAVTLALDPAFEHGILTLDGSLAAAGAQVPRGLLRYLPAGSPELRLTSEAGARAVLIGGLPFGEQLVMWWNFVGRSHEDIASAREAWESERARDAAGIDVAGPEAAHAGTRRFAPVAGFAGDPLPAPPLPPLRLLPRDQRGRRPGG